MARWAYPRPLFQRHRVRGRSLERRPAPLRRTVLLGWCLLIGGLILTIWRIAGLAAHLDATPARITRPVLHASARFIMPSIPAAQVGNPIVPASPDLGAVLPVSGMPSLPAPVIDGILAAYGSPLQGHGSDIVSLSVQYHIDDAVALAFFVMESRAGTQGEAVLTHSFGNLRPMPNQPSLDGYRYYKTWLDGATEWFQVMRNLYLNQMKLSSVEDIIPIYAPSVDSNEPDSMTYGIRQLVSCWRGDLDACPADPPAVPDVVQAYRKALAAAHVIGPVLPRPR